MIRIPVYLFVAQWALLAALGVLVVIMYRQLGRLLTGSDKAADLGPEVGGQAPALTYITTREHQERPFTPGDEGPALVAFADPTCPSCEQLVAVLGEMRSAGELEGIRTLVLISDPPSYLQISEVFSASELEIGRPVRRSGLDSYGLCDAAARGHRRTWCAPRGASSGPPGPACGEPASCVAGGFHTRLSTPRSGYWIDRPRGCHCEGRGRR